MADMHHPDEGSFERMTSGQWFMPSVNEEVSAEHRRGFLLAKELNELQNTNPERAKEICGNCCRPSPRFPGCTRRSTSSMAAM